MTSKAVGAAFNAALGEAGGSVPVWLILSSVKHGQWSTQLELARALDIEGPTLTRHLDNLEGDGLVKRLRSDSDRRAYRATMARIAELPARLVCAGHGEPLARAAMRAIALDYVAAYDRDGSA